MAKLQKKDYIALLKIFIFISFFTALIVVGLRFSKTATNEDIIPSDKNDNQIDQIEKLSLKDLNAKKSLLNNDNIKIEEEEESSPENLNPPELIEKESIEEFEENLTPQELIEQKSVEEFQENSIPKEIIEEIKKELGENKNVSLESENKNSNFSEQDQNETIAEKRQNVPKSVNNFLEIRIDNYKIPKVNAKEISQLIAEESGRLGIDPLFVAAVIYTESTFKKEAINNNKTGLFQITPEEAKNISKANKIPYLGDTTLKHPQVNIKLGVLKLKSLMDKYSNNHNQVLENFNLSISDEERNKYREKVKKIYSSYLSEYEVYKLM